MNASTEGYTFRACTYAKNKWYAFPSSRWRRKNKTEYMTRQTTTRLKADTAKKIEKRGVVKTRYRGIPPKSKHTVPAIYRLRKNQARLERICGLIL